MRPPPPKAGYFVLEGTNSFATAYYFNYLMFLLRDAHGFTNLNNLSVGALHGLIYVGASWYGGRFGQRFGYFRSLRIGFGGMALSLALGLAVPALWGQLLALGGWTVAICFTWPMLEALVSEHEPPDRLPDRVGLYNVIWAGTAALGFSVGGLIFEHLGHASLYWLPLTIHACQWLAIGSLQRRHDRWFRIPRPRRRDPSHTTPPSAPPTSGASPGWRIPSTTWPSTPSWWWLPESQPTSGSAWRRPDWCSPPGFTPARWRF